MSINTEKTNQKFQKEYDKLNKQQKLAVDTIEGPVLVNAGPGTGKTQILALRIGNILTQTDTNPANILCLTFTENGAIEMRSRLLKSIGVAAYNIRIHTFHSFCNEVIQDNLSYFGKLNLEPISDLEEIDLFNRLTDSIERDNILKRFKTDAYNEVPRLKSLFSLMKKEAWTIDYLNERIDDYIASLPSKEGFFYKRKHKQFNAGDPNPNRIAAETEKMEMLRAAIKLYPRYNEMIWSMSRYTFDDMILWVLDAFEKNKNLLLDYQEKFLYVLVDEFQDTSRSQNLLLQFLVNYWEIPNLFVVGDADQSIFSFQDANVENIIEFEKQFSKNITKVDLINNYRSSQIILDTSHSLIVHNNLRTVSIAQSLIAVNDFVKNCTTIPSIVEYPSSAHESMDVVIQIEELLTRGISGKEIAVIYRNHKQVEQIIQILEAKKIPVNTRRKIDLLQLPFIQNIISIMDWIDKESNIPFSADDVLFKLLHFEFFHIKPSVIAKISMNVNEKNIGRKEDRYSIRRQIEELHLQNGDLFTQPDNNLKDTSILLENLLKSLHNVTLEHLVEMIIQKAGVLGYIMQNPAKPWLMECLNSFFNFVKDSCKRKPDTTLHELLQNISLMRKNRLSIPLYRLSVTDNGINLITAHSSKGSEFDYVFLVGCIDKIWDDKKGDNRSYRYPDNLIGNAETASDLEEDRRLFYVAMTRAKTNLKISYYSRDSTDKPHIKSTFVTEIQEGMGWQAAKISVPDAQLTNLLALQFAETARPEIELVEENYITQLLKKYSLSVTHLSNYLYCPIKFYYQNLIKVPSAKNENMMFGSAIHFALQRLFEKMKQHGGVFPPAEILLDDFNWFMQKNRDAFTAEEFARRTIYGEKILPDYYYAHVQHWNKIVRIEHNIRNVALHDIPLNGKLDKLEFLGKQVNVVDYKTGKFSNAKKKMLPPDQDEPNGGDYWRQAVFYKILMDNDITNDWQNISTAFEFVEPVNDQYLVEKIIISPADITTVTQQIKSVWQKIQAREFKIGCGRAECEWCNFVKKNGMSVALHQMNEEEAEL